MGLLAVIGLVLLLLALTHVIPVVLGVVLGVVLLVAGAAPVGRGRGWW